MGRHREVERFERAYVDEGCSESDECSTSESDSDDECRRCARRRRRRRHDCHCRRRGGPFARPDRGRWRDRYGRPAFEEGESRWLASSADFLSAPGYSCVDGASGWVPYVYPVADSSTFCCAQPTKQAFVRAAAGNDVQEVWQSREALVDAYAEPQLYPFADSREQRALSAWYERAGAFTERGDDNRTYLEWSGELQQDNLAVAAAHALPADWIDPARWGPEADADCALQTAHAHQETGDWARLCALEAAARERPRSPALGFEEGAVHIRDDLHPHAREVAKSYAPAIMKSRERQFDPRTVSSWDDPRPLAETSPDGVWTCGMPTVQYAAGDDDWGFFQ